MDRLDLWLGRSIDSLTNGHGFDREKAMDDCWYLSMTLAAVFAGAMKTL